MTRVSLLGVRDLFLSTSHVVLESLYAQKMRSLESVTNKKDFDISVRLVAAILSEENYTIVDDK